MTLKALRVLFKDKLSAIYPPSEIESIFQILAKYKLGFDSATLILEGKKEVNLPDLYFFQKSLERLQKNEPIQYIIGESYFYELLFKVNSSVLIPRPETEELVQWIITDVKDHFLNKKIQILDIGTGSGCIAISLAKNLPNAEVWALDISDEALDIAKENAVINKVSIHFLQADILQLKKLPQTYDIIVSNPPYIRQAEKKQMHHNVLEFEPDKALYVQDDNPLLFYKKITELALKYLTKNGSLYFEINQYLGEETVQLLKSFGLAKRELRKDLLGNDRMLRGGSL